MTYCISKKARMKKIVVLVFFLAGMAACDALAVVSVSKDLGYVQSIFLEGFNGGSDPATGKQQLALGSIGGGLATYDYPANAGSEGYAVFSPASTAYDPGAYASIRTRMHVAQNAGWKAVQFYPAPIGGAGVVSKDMEYGLLFALSSTVSQLPGGSGAALREYCFDLSALPDDGSGFRFDPVNYPNDAVADRWDVDYFMADRGPTKGVEFDHDGDYMGIATVQMASSVSNGALQGTAAGNDAKIYLHRGRDLAGADADTFKYVEIRMKGSGDRVDLFWSTTATPGIGQVILESAGGDTDYHTYLVDFSTEAGWTGTIDYLRLDPNTTPGKSFEVDYVRLIVPDMAVLGTMLVLKEYAEQLPQEADSFRAGDPLFATWLDGQHAIQTRLINNIMRDQLQGTRFAARVGSELDDLRYMQSRIDGEMAYLRNLPPDDGSVINVLDYGAVGDGVADDGVAIADAIAAAAASATNTVFLPSGKYFIGEAGTAPTGSYHLRLEQISNLLIKGEAGTELVFGNPVRGGIDIVDCVNVRLKDFSITYRPLPYTLGTVAEVVSNGYVLTVREGFPAPTEPYFQANDFGGLSRFFSAALLPGSVRPEFSNAAPHLSSPSVTQLSSTNFLFEYGVAVPGSLPGLNVCFQARMFGNMAVAIRQSDRCRVENLNVYASPAMAFLSNGSDMTFINNCFVGPDPEMPASFASSNADGIFVRDALMGGLISSNSIHYIGDDFLNIHNLTYPVYDASGSVVYIQGLDERILKAGNRIGWIFGSIGEKHVSGEAFIESVETVGSLYKVTCDRILPAFVTTLTLGPDPARPDYLCVMEDQFHGGVVVGNTFSHGISRFLLGGRNWLFADNTVEDSLSNPYLFNIGPRALGRAGGEGFQPRNILLERNHLACRSKTVFSIQGEINSEMQTDDLLATTHIDIEDNTVELSGVYGQEPFAGIDDASVVSLVGNRVTNGCDSIIPAFEFGNCGDVLLEGNSVVGNFTQLYSSEPSSEFVATGNTFSNTPVQRTVYTAWDFSQSADIAEWQVYAVLHDVQFLASTNTLRLRITGSDPYIKFPPFSGGVGLSCVVVEMRYPRLENSANQLYWRTATGGYSETSSQVFSIRLNPFQSGDFNIHNLLGALNPRWVGSDVSGLRMDPFSGIPINSVVEICWIKLTDGPVY